MKKFRISLFLLLALPLVISFGCFYYFYQQFSIAYAVGFIGLLFESFFLQEIQAKNEKDSGMLSGLLISILLSVMCFIASAANKDPLVLSQIVATIIALLGVALRTYSKVTLGRFFSHSLRIIDNHQLVEQGLFGVVLHPAYIGTILLITGMSLYINGLLALSIGAMALFLALKRIGHEEIIMADNFGDKYQVYQQRTWKLIPFII